MLAPRCVFHRLAGTLPDCVSSAQRHLRVNAKLGVHVVAKRWGGPVRLYRYYGVCARDSNEPCICQKAFTQILKHVR